MILTKQSLPDVISNMSWCRQIDWFMNDGIVRGIISLNDLQLVLLMVLFLQLGFLC